MKNTLILSIRKIRGIVNYDCLFHVVTGRVRGGYNEGDREFENF